MCGTKKAQQKAWNITEGPETASVNSVFTYIMKAVLDACSYICQEDISYSSGS